MTPVVVVVVVVFFFWLFLLLLFSERACVCAAHLQGGSVPLFRDFFSPKPSAKGLRIQKGAKFFSREVKFFSGNKRKAALSYKNDSKYHSRHKSTHSYLKRYRIK